MTDQEQRNDAALESWKAIAGHLKRDVRTAKRWEQFEGLPVHRHLHRSRSSVYAFPAELDAWWAARSPAAPAPAPSRRLTPQLAFALALMSAVFTSGGRSPAAVGVAAQQAGPSLTEVFAALQLDAGGRFSPDGRSLAGSENGYLIVADVETEQRRRLTATNWDQRPYGFAQGAIWSRDGKRIAYGWYTGKQWEARVVPVEGGPSSIFFNRTDFFPADWTPDGRHLLGWSLKPDGRRSLGLASEDGELTELRAWANLPSRPSLNALLSPDGRYVAYDTVTGPNPGIAVLDISARTETRLTVAPNTEQLPVWTRDGKSLLFVSDRSGRLGLWTIAMADGTPSGNPQLVYSDVGDIRSMVGWDREGRLLFARRVSFGQLYTVRVDPVSGAALSAPERPVRQFEGNHMQAAWSPAGNRLALLAETRPRGALYIVTPDKGDARELSTKDLAWQRIAGWTPSGDALAISSSLGPGVAVHLVRLADGNRQSLYADRELNWASAQLSPDGAALVGSLGPRLRVIDIKQGRPIRELTLPGVDGYGGFAWTARSDAIFALTGDRVVRVPVPSGEPREVVKGSFRSLALSPDGRTLALSRVPSPDSNDLFELFIADAKEGRLARVQLPSGHRPWRVRWASADQIGYISLEARAQTLRLSNFLPSK
jgi:Tol biopolymer transport system component